jgi:hypothetical protein
LTIANDKFALAATNRDQCVQSLKASLHWLAHALARDDAGGFHLNAAALGCLQRAFAVDRIAEAIHYAAQQFLTDGNVNDGAGPLNSVTLADFIVAAEDNRTNIVGF